MSQPLFHGTTPSEEIDRTVLARDTRTLPRRALDALSRGDGYLAASAAACSLMLLRPSSVFLVLPVMGCLFLRRMRIARREHLAMRVPATWKGVDPADIAPSGRPRRARGTFFLGNEAQGNRELWASKEDVLTHTLVLGTTGAGKTETLVSLAFSYLAQGSGFLYVDPKAAPKLAVQIYVMCRMLGRDDDFLLLSYMSDREGRRRPARTPMRRSNTTNPFCVGTAPQLTQLLFALMPENEKGGSIFQANAMTLISGLMAVLTELRDRGEAILSVSLIRGYLMDTAAIDALARRTDLSEQAVLSLRSGLAACSWDIGRPLENQPRSFPEQYGYARAYFGRALSLLTDTYGRIFQTARGEIDATDVITGRRVFVTLIPSLDKDPKELKNLGQLCLSSVRSAAAVGLGNRVQGRVSDVLGSLPTDARVPFGVIVDEYAAIETPGFEMLLTQGRGLGMAVTVASQDFAGIRRASEAAAEQIVSNTKVKLFMTLEDPRQTWDLVNSLAGEANVMEDRGMQLSPTGSGAWTPSSQARAESRRRADFRDLQRQTEGEFTAFFKGGMIRGRVFHADPPLHPETKVRLAVLLRVNEPGPEALARLVARLDWEEERKRWGRGRQAEARGAATPETMEAPG